MWILLPLGGKTEARILDRFKETFIQRSPTGGPLTTGGPWSLKGWQPLIYKIRETGKPIPAGFGGVTRGQSGCYKERFGALEFISFNSTSGDEISGNGIYYLACVILEARVIKS